MLPCVVQEWEWQAEDAPGTGPFTPEDVAQAPPPGETLIGRMLAASGHVAAVSTEAAAADAAAAAATNAGGGGAITGTATGAGPSSAAATQPLTTTTGPGAGPGTAGGTPAVSSAPGATGAAAGGSAAPAPSISTASGAAPAGLLPAGQKRQRIPSAIALEAAASAQYGAVAAASPPTKRIKLKAKVTTPGSAAAAFGYAGSAGGTGGGGGSGAEPARTSSRSRGGATGPQGAGGGGASMSSAPGGGMDGEVGSAEKADGVRAAGEWVRACVGFLVLFYGRARGTGLPLMGAPLSCCARPLGHLQLAGDELCAFQPTAQPLTSCTRTRTRWWLVPCRSGP